MPAFNESATIVQSVKRVISVVGSGARLIVVDDGSIDNTAALLEENFGGSRQVELVANPSNGGKGAAIRAGAAYVKEEYFAYIDADFDIHPDALVTGLKTLLANPHVTCAYGSKVHPESQVVYPTRRRLISSLFSLVLRLFFGFGIRDTQTGLKVFSTEVALPLLMSTENDGWLLDLELFLKFRENMLQVVEIPVRLDYQFTSNIRPTEVFRIARELLIFKRKYG